MIKRLKLKFICINMVIVTAMLLVIFSTVLHLTQANLEQQSERMLQSVLESRGHPRPGELSGQAQLPYFYVSVNSFGELSATFSGYYDLTDTDALQEIISLTLSDPAQSGVLKDCGLRFLKRTTPFGQSIVFADMSSELATMGSLVKNCVIIGIASFIAFLGLSFLLAGWAVKPVESAWNQQRQFVSDASHELKTPLTVILTNAELLQQGGYAEEDREKFVSSILTMSHQMRGLVESLLELARVDNGGQNMVFSRLNYSELVTDALLPFEPVYFEKGLLLESEVAEGVFVKGSAQHLKQVLDILLDNASKYAAPDSTVQVTLRTQGAHCLLSAANPGEEISKEDLKNIFKRFYRVDKARSMNHSYGLGLAIAEGIIHRHNGKIWAESGGGINTFFVQLPLA